MMTLGFLSYETYLDSWRTAFAQTTFLGSVGPFSTSLSLGG